MKILMRIFGALVGLLFLVSSVTFFSPKNDLLQVLTGVLFGLMFLSYSIRGYVFREDDSYSVDIKARKKKATENAIKIAQAILAETINPIDGCIQIAELSVTNYYPDELNNLGLLSDETSVHEKHGTTNEILIPSIVEECERLVTKHS